MWVSTGTGLCRYDGFSFTPAVADSLTEAFAGVSFKDSKGNLWFGHSNGSISVFNGRKFEVISVEGNVTSSINGLTEDKDGNILAISQSNGLIRINKRKKAEVLVKPFEGKLLYALNITMRNELLIGTDDGVIVYSYGEDLNSIKETGKIEKIALSKVQSVYKQGNADLFFIGTEDAGFFKIFRKEGQKQFQVENLGAVLNLEYENIQAVYQDLENNLWISTFGKGLIKAIVNENGKILDAINYNSVNGLGSDYIKNVFQDREGNIWVSTYGNGLAALVDESFTFFDYRDKIGKNISAVAFHPGGYFLGGDKGLLKVTNGIKKEVKILWYRQRITCR
ncbi:MAG: hypothetical protein HC905_04780 [Bacteroidales bacterium]|nr:hypothetical protein [Bacteroidales bacterium]